MKRVAASVRIMDRPLRFCMITTFYPPYNFGGDGVYIHSLSNELARRGHHIDVIHCKDAYLSLAGREPANTYSEHPNVRVHSLSSPFGFLSPLATQQTGFPLFKSARIREILAQPFDVIHYHNISLIGGPKILEYGCGIKLVTMHDYWLVCPTHALFRFNRAPCTKRSCFLCTLSYKRLPQWWRYSNLLKTAIKNVDAFIAPSLTSQRKHAQMGLNAYILHIPNFVPRTEWTKPVSDKSNGRAPVEPYFLFVGRLEKLKGLKGIIPIFRDYTKAQLWIAGTGSEERLLRQMAQGSSNIRFLGYQTGEPLQKLYGQAVALIYPAANFQTGVAKASVASGQGAPLVIMEAFSQRTPVIASNGGTIPALVQQSGGGIVYSTAEELIAAMNHLLTDQAYRRELGLRGYNSYQQNWTAEAHLKRYFALIDEIAAGRNSSSTQRTSQVYERESVV
jgi:glycosyltransferase involved in cell wall biosynthesis